MSLEDIREKEPTIATPSAHQLADSPAEWESKFRFHVATYVTVADVHSRWSAILNNLLNHRSVTGLIYADKGYGKTSTGASLWQSAEAKQIVAVPPFAWNSLADMLTATHGWICYRLQPTMPELIPDLEKKHRAVVEVDEETLAQRMVSEDGLSYEEARKAIRRLKREGRLLYVLSPYQLLDYLRLATQTLLKAGYKGLLILPDEFELFKNNPDTAQNYQQLKDFIFGLYGEENLPIGCVAFTYNRTFADIELRASQILDRFNKPEGSLINLEQFYGQTEFAKHLWEKLAISCSLSDLERNAIDDKVLDALGQFLRHARSRELISGPRSVVRTFRRAAHHYIARKTPYSLLDFCDDFLSGGISYGAKESEVVSAQTQIIALPGIQNNVEKQKLIKLLCVHPEGIPKEIFQEHDIPDPVRETVIQDLLGQHVITKVTGPTLTCYRDDLLGVDELNEILKILRASFIPTDREFHRGAVRAFNKHVLSTIFTKKTGASLGWVKTHEATGNQGLHYRRDLKGTVSPEYPERTLTVNIATEIMSIVPPSESQFSTTFILDTIGDADKVCHITANTLEFRFNIKHPIDAQKIPADIGKLGELFLPESITPLLLLSILDFFDDVSIISRVEGAKQDTEVNFLKKQILDELTRYFFSPEVKAGAVFELPELSANFASLPAGKDFIEGALRILIPKKFPEYSAVATSAQWKRYLDAYSHTLSNAPTLGVKHGIEPIRTTNPNVPQLFKVSGVNAFRNFHNVVGRELLRVDDNSGKPIEVQNKNEPVAVYFTRHPLENRLVKQLQNSTKAITIDTAEVNAVELSTVYQHGAELGYLNEEIDALIAVLKARGMADRQNVAGLEYLYLVERFISFGELKAKLEGLEQIASLAQLNGFTFQCENLATAQASAQTIGIESDEVRKDALRQELNSAETNLNNHCEERVRTELNILKQKVSDIETLQIEVPHLLNLTTGHPLTEFSQILFQNIQLKVKSAYTKISQEIWGIRARVRETCDREIGTYESNQTSQNAIETAVRLRDYRSRVDADIKRLIQARNDVRALSDFFEHWRVLASQIEYDKQLMMDTLEDAVVQNLINRLDIMQRDIRQHLADNRMSLQDVLGNHEYFKTQCLAIKDEFNQFLTERKDAFIAYQSSIAEQLRHVSETPLALVDFNPIDSEGCYQKVRKNAVAKLNSVVDEVQSESDQRKRELLKPIEVFKVPKALRTKAIQLREGFGKLDEEFQNVRCELTPEEVDIKLPEWVDKLLSKLEEGQPLADRRRQIERELDELVPDLSLKAQRLRDELAHTGDFTELIVRLRSDGSFNSAKEILESLEELYEANLVNLTVRGR